VKELGIGRLFVPACSKIWTEGLKQFQKVFRGQCLGWERGRPGRISVQTISRRLNVLTYFLILTFLMPVVLGISWAVPPQAISTPFSPAPVSRDIMERNKKAALEFYDLAINKKDYEAASKYIGSDYKQHNPLVGDGREDSMLLVMLKDFPQCTAK
jgi:hypothetical protein